MQLTRSTVKIMLLVCLIFSLIPLFAVSASAAINTDANALTALGIDTSALPDGYDDSETAENPYGVDITTVCPVPELYLEKNGTTTVDVGGTPTLVPAKITTLYGNELSLGVTVNDFYTQRVSNNTYTDVSLYDAYRSSDGGFTGNGLNGQAVTVAAKLNPDNPATADIDETSYDLDLYLSDPNVATAVPDTAIMSLLNDVTNFGNQGKNGFSGEDFSEFPYQLQNYLQVETGDFTGDGIDEIAVFIPERGSSRVEIYQLQIGSLDDPADIWQNSAKWDLLWVYSLQEGMFVSNMVSLTAGDMTGDGVDDLGITWGVYYSKDYKTACRAIVLHGGKSNYFFDSTAIDLSLSGDTNILRAALALGDSDGDGVDELVLGGQLSVDINSGDYNTRYLATYEYSHTGATESTFVRTASGNMDLVDYENDAGEDGKYYSAPFCVANMAIVKQDGVGTQEYIYLDSVLYQQAGDSFTIIDEMDESGIPTETSPYRGALGYAEYGAHAGDFNGDGKETVMFAQYYAPLKITLGDLYGDIFWWAPDLADYELENLAGVNRLLELDTSLANVLVKTVYSSSGMDFTFAMPDTDTDTAVLHYSGKHYLAYSDPKVLAVLASPPYFADLEHLDGGDSYVGNSQTTYGETSGSSTSENSSNTVNVGAYISFEQEFSIFGIKAAKFEAEVEYSHGWTWETESVSEQTQTVEYATFGGQDTVVLYSIPVDVFVYDAYIPETQADGSVVWKEQTMTVNIPYQACVKTLTLEDYDDIAADYQELQQISGTVLNHTVGDPATYPTSTAGYSDLHMYDGDFAGVAFGSSSITQSLEMTEEESSGTSQTNAVSFKAGGGAGGVVVGVTAGWEGGAGEVTTSISGNSISGTVVGMPEEAEGYGYNYSWKVFEYTCDGKQTFPVVNYLVTDVTSPPKLPSDFEMDVEATTDTSITLTWGPTDPTVAGYQIYRHYDFPDGSGDYPVGDVIGANDSQFLDPFTGKYHYYFTDTGLNPYTEYQYRIQVINGVIPYYSVPSDILTARTEASTGQPTITLYGDTLEEDNTLPVFPDKNSSVRAIVTNDAPLAQAPLYQWQKKIDGVWTSLNGKTTDTLTFSAAGSADAGLYRCRVNQIVGEYAISAYSETVTVVYAKRPVSIDLSITKDDSADMNPLIEAVLSNLASDSGSHPTGTVTFEISGDGYSVFHTVDVEYDSDRGIDVATVDNWTAPRAGIYEVTAYYSGSLVFKSIDSERQVFLAGNSADYWLDIDDAIVYGDSLTPQVTQYAYEGEDLQSQLLTGVDGDDYTLEYSVYKAVSYYEDSATIDDFIQSNYDGFYEWYLSYIYTVWYPYLDIWIPMDGTYAGYDSPVSGDSITPRSIGNYLFYITVKDGGDVVDLLSGTFQVNQRPITIMAPTINVAEGNAVQPTADLLIYDASDLIFGDTIDSLGLGVKLINSAGQDYTITADEHDPGQYTSRVITDGAYAAAQANYSFIFVDGIYNIIGATYDVTGVAEKLLGATVGDISLLSPEGHDDSGWTDEYQMGTQLVFSADPDIGYSVAEWQLYAQNTEGAYVLVDTYYPADLTNPNILIKTMPANAIQVRVRFEVTNNTLTYSGVNGKVQVVGSSLVSGAIVIENAEYTFMAIPDEGYHFKEWRLFAGSTSYPVGDIDADGFHTYTLTMGDVPTSLYAIFERDKYVLTLGDNLHATYVWTDPNDVSNHETRIIPSGSTVTGDTEITVAPATGYQMADGGKWYVDGEPVITVPDDPLTPTVDETVYYSGSSYIFDITQATFVDADTELQYYDISVGIGWSGSGADPGGNTVTATVDGVETPLDSLTDIPGGSEVILTAEPAYGSVFSQWTKGDANIADYTVNGNVLTCSALGGDLDVSAVFTNNDSYTVTVTKGLHGSLEYSLNGKEAIDIEGDTADISVYEGDDLVFTAMPDMDFMVGYWTIDGVNHQTTIKTWSLTDIDEGHTLSLSFTPMSYYKVEFSAGDSGDIEAVKDGTVTLNSGDRPGGGTKITFTATPDEGFMVDTWTEIWKVNGEVVQTHTVGTDYDTPYVAQEYIIEALAHDTEILVTFKAESLWAIDILEPDNGEIAAAVSPDDYDYDSTNSIRDGGAAIFTVIPDAGCEVYDVDLEVWNSETSDYELSVFDDIDINSDGSWTCKVYSVNEDIRVSADIPRLYTITKSVVTGGTVNAPATASEGEKVDISATLKTGYTFSGWTITPEIADTPIIIDSATSASTYFYMPACNVTVTPAFTYNGGGGGFGGGGGGSTFIDIYVGGNSILLSYDYEKGVVTLELSRKIIGDLTDMGMMEDGVVFDLSGISGAKQVVLPTDTGILDAESLTIVLPALQISFDKDTLNLLEETAGGGEISITGKVIDKSGLTPAQQAAVGDNPVYDLTVLAGGEQVSDLGGQATVTIPYSLGEGDDPDGIVVWYLKDDGELVQVPCIYDEKTGSVTFVTEHFSRYAVVYDDSAVWVNPFNDVASGSWYYDSAAFVTKNGLFNGTSATTFSPNQGMTRAMFVTVLGRMSNVDITAYSGVSFSDVAAGSWYGPYVEWAVQNGIVSGYGGGVFGVNDLITREQMASILARYIEVMDIKITPAAGNVQRFSDYDDISAWARTAVEAMQSHGLIQGLTGNNFAPQNTATRAEVAVLLARFIKTVE